MTGTCTENQVKDELDNHKWVEEKDICLEYNADRGITKHYTTVAGKKCAQFILQTNNNGKTYYDKTIYSNAIANVADGEFIKDVNGNESKIWF